MIQPGVLVVVTSCCLAGVRGPNYCFMSSCWIGLALVWNWGLHPTSQYNSHKLPHIQLSTSLHAKQTTHSIQFKKTLLIIIHLCLVSLFLLMISAVLHQTVKRAGDIHFHLCKRKLTSAARTKKRKDFKYGLAYLFSMTFLTRRHLPYESPPVTYYNFSQIGWAVCVVAGCTSSMAE